ncbi:hypothetical protein AB0M42_04425 [Streptomyces sp. NPDC051784]|uniref:hypothetical protein n=1 Tax=Streptomyces sp. NPDC051784 TaxID=3155805 RepID=UPI003412A31A
MPDRTRAPQSGDTQAGTCPPPAAARLLTAWHACTLAETAGTAVAQALADSSQQRACDLLEDIVHLLALTGPLLESAVASERLSGTTWEEIATILRLTPEAARARYGPAVERFQHHRSHPEPEPADSSTYEERWNTFPVLHPHEAARDLAEWLGRQGLVTNPAEHI